MRRVLADSAGDNLHLLEHVVGVLEHCDACRALDRAPRVPIAGTSTVSMLNEKLQVDRLFSDDVTASPVLDVFSM